MKFKTLLVVILFFLQSCGYSPVYYNSKNIDYKLNIVEIKSNDPIIRNLIKVRLKNLSNENGEKIINLRVTNSIEKEILSKNKKNEITDYKIKQNINFEIISEKEQNKLFKFNDEIKVENINDQFEFKKYQDVIIQNFINSKIDEFILKISTI
ncbi:hypothetical protein [Candidatus Pelagibacter sp. HIMB1542]|uniref:hypothetical protein n=1 Tax=Candidatus Pelagibacter sp. HIMB1542 TaxID=3413346 RepID=UPI003F854050